MKPGPKNLITDVAGLLVGNAHDAKVKTGATVLCAERPITASVDVMGGAPGTRETDCLDPDRMVTNIDAIVLSGGSAFGLDAASGVSDRLRAQGKGFEVGDVRVPIVPSAIVFDLINGGDKQWETNPYPALGGQALDACGSDFELGTAGVGVGCTTAVTKGGLGSASLVLDNGITVGALVAVNPHGSPVVPGASNFWAAPFEMGNEFGGLGVADHFDPFTEPENEKLSAYESRGNTTIAIVATDAKLTKPQLKRLAVGAHDGMARALVPSHTPFDGDLVFSVSTGERDLDASTPADVMLLGHAASLALARAIARGVYLASPEPDDTLPTWSQKFGGS